jgi:DNA-binding GntR family transcriptional regulator
MASGDALHGLTSESLADQAYRALREAIISGELSPEEKITERGLADRLSVSPTPIREALRRLEQDGLVERPGPRLVQVVDLDSRPAAEIRLAEGALRAVAARLAATNATEVQLARMERMLDEGDEALARLEATADGTGVSRSDELGRLLDATRRFHAELNAGCNNPVILRMLDLVDAFQLAARRERLANELDHGSHGALERYHQHRALLDVVRAGDGVGAERLMREHVDVDVTTSA